MAAVLKLNSSGSDVKKVQKLLNKKLKLSLAEDGKFGPDMETAVREYQKKNKLKVDGKVGSETLAHLMDQASNGASGGGGADKAATKSVKELAGQATQTRKALEAYLKLVDKVDAALKSGRDDANEAAIGLMGVNRDLQQQTKVVAGACGDLDEAVHRMALSILE